MKVNVVTLDQEKVGDIALDESVFGLEERKDILHRVVQWQRAKRRAGTHKTKGISEVSGTTRKPFKQKGTGNARMGTSRAPQCRGGGTVFGPVVRSHAINLPKKVRKLGLRVALSVKAKQGKLSVVKGFDLAERKTSELVKKKAALLGKGSALFIDGNVVNENISKAAGNLFDVNVLPQQGANVYDILRHEHLVLSEEAVKCLEDRLK